MWKLKILYASETVLVIASKYSRRMGILVPTAFANIIHFVVCKPFIVCFYRHIKKDAVVAVDATDKIFYHSIGAKNEME